MIIRETTCPICMSDDTSIMHRGDKGSHYREFIHCSNCDLVFVPRNQILSPSKQKDRYLQHNNDIMDEGYRKFLNKLYSTLVLRLNSGSHGLDYGCGPRPALAQMAKEDGFTISIYDPIFFPDKKVLEHQYNFITCTEAIEHFSDPRADFHKLDNMLSSGGLLGIMTGILESWSNFPQWYYHRDSTHINFFSKNTLTWISTLLNYQVSFPRENVAIFYKP